MEGNGVSGAGTEVLGPRIPLRTQIRCKRRILSADAGPPIFDAKNPILLATAESSRSYARRRQGGTGTRRDVLIEIKPTVSPTSMEEARPYATDAP